MNDSIKDSMQEYLYVVDDKNQPLKKKKLRSQVHKDGDWHRTAQFFVLNKKNEVLMNLRSKIKSHYPSLWSPCNGGHINYGEEYDSGAVREFNEEFSFKIKKNNLFSLGIYKLETKEKKINLINREFIGVYVYFTDKKESEIKFDKNEISKVKFVNIKKLKNLINGKDRTMKLVPTKRYLLDIIDLIEKIFIKHQK